jgi:hypothetical protein
MKRKSWTLLTLATLAAIAAGILLTPARSLAATKPAKSKPAVELYDVVQIGDEIKVISAKSLKDEQKRVKDANDKAVKEWKKAKKRDKDSSIPKPAPLTVKLLKKNIKDKDDADQACQDLKDKLEKKEDSKPPKKGTN